MPSGTGGDWQARRASSGDAEAVESLINAHSRHHYGEDRVGLDEVLSWFASPGVPQDDTRCWQRRDGTMIAYAQVYRPEFPSGWDALHDATVLPSAAGETALWDDIFAWSDRHQWAVQQAHRGAGTGLCCGARVHEKDAAKRRQYESRGFRHVRDETLMRVDLFDEALVDFDVPEGIRVRRLDPAMDMEGYSLAYGEAFRDHWGYVDLPQDEWLRRKKAEFESWGKMYVPELWFVALDGDTVVGSAGSFLDYGNVTGRCYMYHVFVRRAWRNRRIANALLRTAFRSLRERGGRTAELHVDSENMTHGLELYRGLGMRPVWHQFLYEKTVPESSRPPLNTLL